MAEESSGATGEEVRLKGLSNPRLRLGLLIAGIMLLLAGAYWYYNHQTVGRFQQSTDNAFIAAESVIISPKVAGYVERVLVAENETVASGDALVQLDTRDYRAQTNQVEAQIAATLAGADTARAQQREQEAAIAQARAQLAAASAQASLAAEQVSRYRPLAASGAEPREKLDQLQAQAREAQAQLAAARAALTGAQRRQNTLGEQIVQANSQANAARAQLDAARSNLSSTTLRASISGRVGDLTVRSGQFVQPGQRLMSVVPTDRLELKGKVESIAPGTGAEFSILPPQNATGNFTKIVQRVPVRISLQAPPEVLRLLVPGMSVVATVDTRAARDELDSIRNAAED